MSHPFNSARVIAVTKPVIEGLHTVHDLISYCARISNPENQLNIATAQRLTAYLVRHKHWSPFAMANVVVEIATPRDIARQLLRHKSFDFQEFSQRYAEAQNFCLREARMQDAKNRQNSVPTEDVELLTWWHQAQQLHIENSQALYQEALRRGLAKEVSRVVLPEGLTMSYLTINGNIRSWIHYLEVRLEEGVTQEEHVALARLIAGVINEIFPVAAVTWDT